MSKDLCFWCEKDCGGNCLGVNHVNGPKQMIPEDPAYFLLSSGHTTPKTAHSDRCYICRDPEYAQMGLPLCTYCGTCTAKEGQSAGHIPADDVECSVCGAVSDEYVEAMERLSKETG